METQIVLPKLTNRVSVSDLIITALCEEWPLTIRGLSYRINRKFGLNVTYQAVHKATRRLLWQEIIIKNGKFYKLNLGWLGKINQFSGRMKRLYSRHNILIHDIF